jgi:hypothetical protein
VPAKCLLISDRADDRKLGEHLASTGRFDLTVSRDESEIRSILTEKPQTVVFWDGDERSSAEAIAQILVGQIAPIKVFVITDKPINSYPHLFKFPAFAHHLYRRYDGPALPIFARLATAALTPHPFGIDKYFPQGATSQKISLKRSVQKTAAVDAIQNYFVKQNVTGRLAALVAQATDELLMNAIFDAPVNASGQPYRRTQSRGADFELSDREIVDVSIMSNSEYIGVCVTDQFGSLRKDVILNFLRKDYHDQAYTIRRSDPGAGLGLNGTIQAGLSLVFVAKKNVKTEVMLFFPNSRSYKEFREGFRFVSILAE